MSDTVIANAVRLEQDRHPGLVNPFGLPIFSTEPLTVAERKQLQLVVNAYRQAARAIETAIQVGRVDFALQSMQDAIAFHRTVEHTPRLLGRNR